MMVDYGWAVHRAAHFAAPLAMVDLFPWSPSTAAASITRCAMAASGVALLQPLVGAAGRGWYFTVLGLWSGIVGAAAVALLRYKGLGWRWSRNGLPPTEMNTARYSIGVQERNLRSPAPEAIISRS